MLFYGKNKPKYSKPTGSLKIGRRGTRFEYSEEFLDALDTNDEQKLHEIFSGHDWQRHLEGYWLR